VQKSKAREEGGGGRFESSCCKSQKSNVISYVASFEIAMPISGDEGGCRMVSGAQQEKRRSRKLGLNARWVERKSNKEKRRKGRPAQQAGRRPIDKD